MTLAQFNTLADRYGNEQEWLNWRAGLVASVIANTHRTKKSDKTFKPTDFMPKIKPKQQTPEAMFNQMMIINAALGGKVVENETNPQ